MARKPRIHYQGAFYHVMLRGNGGQEIFLSNADRSRFMLFLQEGVARYRHRIHAFCLMSNHVHLIVQVGQVPLSKIMQNVGFRYTRYINARKSKTGHLFQGRYKALLIDADSYLVELVRYIHCNPVRAAQIKNPGEYHWSSHNAYLGRDSIPWLTSSFVLSQFSEKESMARELYLNFIEDGLEEGYRREFHVGIHEGRILGDDSFSEEALARAEQCWQQRCSLQQIIDAVCSIYKIKPHLLQQPGKKRPGTEARAVAAYLVQEEENLSLTELATYTRRDLAALSRAAGRIRQKVTGSFELADKIHEAREKMSQPSNQTPKRETTGVLSLFKDLDEDLKNALKAQLRNLWTHSSTAIEGNTLSLGETAFVLEEGLTISGKPLKDHEEVVGHARAIELLYELVNASSNLDEEKLFNLHRAVQTEKIFDVYKPVGAWKKEPNSTVNVIYGKQVVFEYPPPHAIPRLMDEWFSLYKVIDQATPHMDMKKALTAYTRLHVSFVRIHPFFDGNGRLARLIANLPILKAGLPPIIIGLENRKEYIENLAEYHHLAGPMISGADLAPDNESHTKFTQFCETSWQTSLLLLQEIRNRQERRRKGSEAGKT